MNFKLCYVFFFELNKSALFAFHISLKQCIGLLKISGIHSFLFNVIDASNSVSVFPNVFPIWLNLNYFLEFGKSKRGTAKISLKYLNLLFHFNNGVVFSHIVFYSCKETI